MGKDKAEKRQRDSERTTRNDRRACREIEEHVKLQIGEDAAKERLSDSVFHFTFFLTPDRGGLRRHLRQREKDEDLSLGLSGIEGRAKLNSEEIKALARRGDQGHEKSCDGEEARNRLAVSHTIKEDLKAEQ